MSHQIGKRLSRVVRPLIAFMVLALMCTASLRADGDDGTKLLFAQRDQVEAFNLATGQGYQIGTTSGLIQGTSYVNFQFTPTGPPAGDNLPIAFSNKVIITDLDGDQVYFDNKGTGTFHLGVPGSSFEGTGGPLTGTYVVTGGTGKFANWKVGTTLNYRAIATNPPNGALGNVYVQVTFQDRD